MEFSGKVRDLAAKHNFADAEYLGYKLKAGAVQLDNENAVATFMRGLEKRHQGCLQAQPNQAQAQWRMARVACKPAQQKTPGRIEQQKGTFQSRGGGSY